MKPFDPRLVREVPAVRRPLALLGALGVVGGALAVAQAFALAALVVAVVRGDHVGRASLVVLVVLAARGAVAAATDVAGGWAGSRVAGVVRRRRIASWLRVPVERRPSTDRMVTIAAEGAASVEPYVGRYLPTLVTAAVVPPLAVLALTDVWSAIIVVLTVPLLPVFAALIGKHTERETATRWEEMTALAGHFLDVVRGLPTLVSYQRADAQVGTVRAVSDRHRRATVRTLRTAFLSSAALELLATISVAMVAVGVGLRLAGGHLALGTALTAILLAPEAYWPIRRVGQEFHAAADGAHALTDLLSDHPGISSNQVHEMSGRSSGSLGQSGPARLAGVTYRYPGSDTAVLHDLHLSLGTGLTALTGPSGSGKTTVLELLAGLREPTSGEVRAPRAHLVTQRPYVAPATVATNLALADTTDPALIPSARPSMAGRTDEIRLGSEALAADTLLGDDGFGLSAGQRALLALERARRSDAPLLLVDEPTAHLDEEATADVRALLVELARSRTVLVVTHDPDLAAVADRVVELQADHRRLPLAPLAPSSALLPPPPGPSARVLLRSHPERQHDTRTRPRKAPRPGKAPEPGKAPRPWWVAGLIGGLASGCGVALTATSGWLVVRASERPVVLTLLTAIVAVRAFGIGRPALRYAERLLSHDAALADLTDRRTASYGRLIPLTPARLGRRRRGDLLTGFVRDLDDVVMASVRVRVPLVAAAVSSLLALVLSAALLPAAGAVVGALLVAVGAVLATGLLIERRTQPPALETRAAVARAAHLATANAFELQAIGATDHAVRALDVAQQRADRSAALRSAGQAFGSGLLPLLTGAATVAMASVVSGTTSAAAAPAGPSAPVAAMLVLVPLALGEVLATLPPAASAFVAARAAGRRIERLLSQPPATTGHPATDRPATDPRTELVDVSASWDGVRTAMPATDLTIEPGEHLAVTGPNGSGKSTLLAVLARQLDPTSGVHLLDGRDVRRLDTGAVRRRVAVLDDEPHVFHGSVRANLLLARPDAQDADAVRALVDAGLGRWLADLPEGLDTVLGGDERGLSGGERARLGLARALLSGRPMLLLDEPVAHLDRPTAVAVLDDLHVSARDRTLVIVTHQRAATERCQTVLRWSTAAQVPARSVG
ncbi:thiol reductant ABC exporter subunit CydC [Luteipulveratus sp. YIM 133132]|uniref:thiol reductant ABC exporter subunit CydC n=1 Tax=Luteipulveratus flavus TaxID=3031728 RepID=UPI0023AF6C9C|nr:thiol reductant ABC exporter subunit CydC [Luteipulveratus sp. YIM 133132]MDE9366729.1 thiol reductant ABC exporter subunit CydC [Luteipulveratus sp. YIM 133132]